MANLLDGLDFDLPPSLVAQHPLDHRDASRMMVLARGRDRVSHHVFRDLPDLLPPDALLVVNNTRVLPRRMVGRAGDATSIEVLLLEEDAPGEWRAMVKRARRIKPGARLTFAGGAIEATAVGRTEEGYWRLRFDEGADLPALLETHGLAPLPPYIRRDGEEAARDRADREAYQTCYAERAGAIAAPTAGLHFTPEVFNALAGRGIEIAATTLHVGVGTFAPIKAADPALHQMHREWYEVGGPTARAIGAARAAGRPIIAVGTTTVRALESWAAAGSPSGYQGWSEMFIRPPFAFQVVDGLLTNFHQPRSTLLLLVAAFHGAAHTMAAYGEAIAGRYRFFSYGDCMLILPRHGAAGQPLAR